VPRLNLDDFPATPLPLPKLQLNDFGIDIDIDIDIDYFNFDLDYAQKRENSLGSTVIVSFDSCEDMYDRDKQNAELANF
jgi:hypothetical protein